MTKNYTYKSLTLNRISRNIGQTPHGYIRRGKRWQHTMIFEPSAPEFYSNLLKLPTMSNY